MGLTPRTSTQLLELRSAATSRRAACSVRSTTAVDMSTMLAGADVDEIAAWSTSASTPTRCWPHLLGAARPGRRRSSPARRTCPGRERRLGALIESHGSPTCSARRRRPGSCLPIPRAPACADCGRCSSEASACPMSIAAELVDAVGGSRAQRVRTHRDHHLVHVPHGAADRSRPMPACPIGRPLANTMSGSPEPAARCPRGAIGELLIGGDGVTRGYHGRPSSPLIGSSVMMRVAGCTATGDLVRWRADGLLEFFGRADSQVSCGVTASSSARSRSSSKVVTTWLRRWWSFTATRDRRDSWLIWSPPLQDTSPRQLRSSVRSERPCPTTWFRERYPLARALATTPNGKVDRLALAAEPAVSGVVDSAGAPEAPVAAVPRPAGAKAISGSDMRSGELAALIDTAWSDTLKIDVIDRNRTFFDHGGNSLQVVTLREALENKLGRSISLVRPLPLSDRERARRRLRLP